jgi:hypothetical protein
VKTKLLIIMGFSVMSGACAQTSPSVQAPAPARTTAPAAAPVDRPPVVATPYYAVAVSRPDRTNDYPVEYRVQVPDTDSRVRVVERMVYGDLRLQQQGETVGRSTGSPGVTVGNK